MKNLRWWVIALIALATVINYIDRQTLSVLWPFMGKEIYPDKTDAELKEVYGIISIVFLFSYAFGQAIFGKIFDWIGTRLGFVLSIGIWSIATILHAFAQGILTFSIFRAILGISEAGNWPGAAKANAEWFPTRERALAQGIFNSGAAVGGLISVPLIAYLALFFSWQVIFILVGAIGLLWLIPWLIVVKSPPGDHPWITEEERQYILTGQKNEVKSEAENAVEYTPSTGQLLSHKQSWGVIIATAAIDPIWWLFIVWIPTYLVEVYQMDVKGLAIYGWVPYLGAMFGAWFGGLLAQNRLKAGWSVNKTRKVVISLGCMIMLPALLMLSNPGGEVAAVLIMATILFGFQTSIGNVQTLPSDLFGGKTVGSLAGFAGMAAKLAAAALTYSVPFLTADGNYTIVFGIGAGLALIAMLSVLLLCPKVEPVKPHGENTGSAQES
ncbi:MFS transporter [Alteromonas sp. W364]|jgi:ACS family hexuronate transporter-like MFS transporter|uniref:MFS transporter n=1 Tax=Alteromonas sp. W364 TaxID=3075610 RepID=UPI0028873D08|nr:MFS transporter [Alteromonas sp. W364]MDT0629398.1 MFS transporter [Alteromonas sp. W364]